jgi:acyl-CoA thioesterase-1
MQTATAVISTSKVITFQAQIRKSNMKRSAICAFCLCLVFFAPGAQAKIANQKTYLSNIVTVFDVPWPNNRTITIVAHGDGVPVGYGFQNVVDTFSSYPQLLLVALKDQFPKARINVITTGVHAHGPTARLGQFEKGVLSLEPDILLIDFGNTYTLQVKESVQAVETMVVKAKAKGIHVILFCPLPQVDGKDLTDPHNPAAKYSRGIRAVADRQGTALVDGFSAAKDYLESGGILERIIGSTSNPTADGHRMIMELLLPWFTSGNSNSHNATIQFPGRQRHDRHQAP